MSYYNNNIIKKIRKKQYIMKGVLLWYLPSSITSLCLNELAHVVSIPINYVYNAVYKKKVIKGDKITRKVI